MIEAIVLAGGFGTRLRSVVSDVPKPMAPIGDKPFLAYLLKDLSGKGVNRVILSVGYMAEIIIKYFGNSYEGMDIKYAIEEDPLGTGGAVQYAMKLCTQDHVYILNGDSYVNIDIKDMEAQWKIDRLQVIVGALVEDASRFGSILVDGGYVISFAEKGKSGPGLINAGCYLLDRMKFNKIQRNAPFSLEKDFFESELRNKNIKINIAEGFFIDIGVPEDYSRMQQKLLNEK
jgi:D-glycero-alpha-D-manno-heptose 1-phosphate guanylyltransferase